MTDTPKRLCGPAALTVSAATQYTVPALTTTVIRSIHVVNTSTTVAANLSLSVGNNAVGTQLFSAFPIAPSAVLDWSGFVVLNPAEILQALASNATLTLTISGIEVA